MECFLGWFFWGGSLFLELQFNFWGAFLFFRGLAFSFFVSVLSHSTGALRHERPWSLENTGFGGAKETTATTARHHQGEKRKADGEREKGRAGTHDAWYICRHQVYIIDTLGPSGRGPATG